jgi:hypothetical protein
LLDCSEGDFPELGILLATMLMDDKIKPFLKNNPTYLQPWVECIQTCNNAEYLDFMSNVLSNLE